MSSVPSQVATTRLPAAPLIKCDFDLGEIRGLSPRALELHLGLYEGYVTEVNLLLEQLNEFPGAAELSVKDRLEREGLVRRFAFEQNGVFLHETFFEALGGGRGSPAANGVFSDAVDISYGGFDRWKQDVVELGKTRGVGWVLACRSKSDDRLLNVWVDDHTRGLIPGFEPVVAFDLWEHAYLLDFKPSRRQDYLQVLFDNMNWDVVESRCV